MTDWRQQRIDNAKAYAQEQRMPETKAKFWIDIRERKMYDVCLDGLKNRWKE